MNDILRHSASYSYTLLFALCFFNIKFQVGDEFVDHLKEFSAKEKEFDAKEMMTSYTLDVISNAGLGVQANSFSDPDNIIRQKVRTTNKCNGTSGDDKQHLCMPSLFRVCSGIRFNTSI